MSLSLPSCCTGGLIGTCVAEASLDVATYLTFAAEGVLWAGCMLCMCFQAGWECIER